MHAVSVYSGAESWIWHENNSSAQRRPGILGFPLHIPVGYCVSLCNPVPSNKVAASQKLVTFGCSLTKALPLLS